jgi:hypothetical protein
MIIFKFTKKCSNLQIVLANWSIFYYIAIMRATIKHSFAGADNVTEPIPVLRAECVIIGNSVSPKIDIILEPTSRGSFCGHANFSIAGSGFAVMLILMPEKVGNVFAQRNSGHVVYMDGSE